jgi:SAM-dependent methyltransferase
MMKRGVFVFLEGWNPVAFPDPYDLIADAYITEHAGFTDDLAFYLDLAQATGGPLLELGCGAGRVTLPLAEAGFDITGVDRSAAMLARCQSAAQNAGVAGRVTCVQADMTALALPQRQFHLAFVALGSFHHLATLGDRRAALQGIRAHVRSGATLALDLGQIELRRFTQMAESAAIVHIGTWQDPNDGAMLTHTAAARIGAEPGTLALTHWYDRHAQGGSVQRVTAETTMALISRAEMDLLLPATGWHVRQVYGDHALDEWDDFSPRMIIVAQAAE